MMNLLPVDIQQEILSYLGHLDKLEYGRCNKPLRSDLIARLRMISLQKERIAQEYLTSESFRKEILGRIVDPYHQLVLKDYNFPQSHLELPGNSQLIPNLVLRILSVYFQDFHRLLPCITQIQRLELEWEKGDSTPVPSISGLRELSLLYYPKSSLASLNDGVQLNKQLDVQSLRYLKIQGGRWFSDVSCLGHIYELHLISCSALVDISCLNHNKIIVVDSCPVVDYSQSFRFSRDITINIFRRSNILTIKGINLDKLEEVHSLTMEIDYMDVTEVLFYTRSLPPSLRVLSLKKTITRFPIPPYHNLKEISFSECREVSLQNLEKIRVVKIDQCHGITDWSPLQGNQNVEISYCRGFTSSKQLSNVKILKLIKNTLMKMEDLNNITHLKLQNLQFDGSPSYFSSSAQGKRLFSSAISLQEIEWRLELKDRISFLYLIMKCPHHKRIVIDHRVSGASLMSFYQRMVKDVGKLYQVEIKPPNKVVLLKREQEKKNGGYSLLGVLLRLLIISNEDDR